MSFCAQFMFKVSGNDRCHNLIILKFFITKLQLIINKVVYLLLLPPLPLFLFGYCRIPSRTLQTPTKRTNLQFIEFHNDSLNNFNADSFVSAHWFNHFGRLAWCQYFKHFVIFVNINSREGGLCWRGVQSDSLPQSQVSVISKINNNIQRICWENIPRIIISKRFLEFSWLCSLNGK